MVDEQESQIKRKLDSVELKQLSILLLPMLKTIAGIYQNRQIELTELPPDVSDCPQVLVTFVNSENIDPVKVRQVIEQLETIAGIQQGFEELEFGQTRPIGHFIQEMQQKYDISA